MDDPTSFGFWVRHQRKTLDLTQQALADRVGCSVMTIRKIEGDLRRPSRQIAEILADALQITESQRPRFIAAGRAPRGIDGQTQPSVDVETAPAAPSAVDQITPRHNLPAQTTTLIGREQEVAALRAALETPALRLLTLTGPGGTGKTRLALQIAVELCDGFPHGVWLVNLAAVSDPSLLASSIAETLDVREIHGRTTIETLCQVLQAQQLLLLIDNFEHLIAAAPVIASLLAAAPLVKVLVTSREALHLTGEHVFSVPPLALPERAATLSAEQVSRYAAVQLFIARAQAVQTSFTVTETNKLAVAKICTQLDGLPLAIELATTWLRLFTPDALLLRLERPLQLLTAGPRDRPTHQQSLRHTIAWSYQLLSDDEQRLLRHLACCIGGCSIAGAAALLGEADVLYRLAALLDKSLLVRSEGPDGEPRLHMLETIRAFAFEQLERHGEAEAAQQRYVTYLITWAEMAAQALRSSHELSWLDQIELEYANLRMALQWCAEHDQHTELAHLCGSLWWFWWMRGYWREGRNWAEQALSSVADRPASDITPRLRAYLYVALGWMWSGAGEFAAARPFAEEGLATLQELGDDQGQAFAWHALIHIRYGLSDLEGSLASITAALTLYRVAGDQVGVAEALILYGYGHYIKGDIACAQAYVEEGLALSRAIKSLAAESSALLILGEILIGRGDYATATAQLEQALLLNQRLRSRHDRSTALNFLAEAAYLQHDYERATILWSQALEQRRALGDRRGMVAVLNNLGRAARARKALAEATQWNAQALQYAHELTYHQGYHWCLLLAGGIAAATGEAIQAAQILGAAEALAALEQVTLG